MKGNSIQFDKIPTSHFIESLVLIPGSGEFVYDTIVQYNSIGKPLNSQDSKTSNVVKTLNKLLLTYPNLKEISLVVGWFGNSKDAGEILISPQAEHKFSYPGDSWSVGTILRENANIVSSSDEGIANWGGTPSDMSVVNLVTHLNNLKIKVTLMPTLYLDTKEKSWRGHITAESEKAIDHFFQEYNKFIIHYANLELVKSKHMSNLLTGFIIGTELAGLTKHPKAVNKLLELAKQCSTILGNDVKISYSANWAEYHHGENGVRPLDKLWADPIISYVGISAYFPLTDLPSSQIDYEKIKVGWSSGENFDYYKNGEQKIPLEATWACKNFPFWWKTNHYTDNVKTAWTPKMKSIVFTEFGFPAVDGCTNEPYKFFDKHSIDGGFPQHSKGEIDIACQEMAIRATYQYIYELNNAPETKNMVSGMFYYSVDARGDAMKATKDADDSIIHIAYADKADHDSSHNLNDFMVA